MDDPCSSEGINLLSRSIGSVAVTHNKTQNNRESFIIDNTKITVLIVTQVPNHKVLEQGLKELNFGIKFE